MTTLEHVGPDDWPRLRDVRLRALADSPTAFGSLLASARGLTEPDWRSRLANGVTVLAVETDGARGRSVAMGGTFEPPEGSTLWVWGMWTDPTARGRGLGGRVLDELIAWCRDPARGPRWDDVGLHVTEGNPGARRLYTGRGFEPTGVWESLREGSDLRCEELRLTLR